MREYKVRVNRAEVLLIMVRRNMSHQDVARRSKLSLGHWYNLINGHKTAGPETRDRIQTVFNNVAWDRLFKIDE